MNERERKGGYWSDFHNHTPARRRQDRKRLQQRRENRKPENFGKINWRAYTHRQLWDMVKSADAARMTTRTYEWKRLADDIDQATADVRKIVQNLALSWRGPSAAAAAESVTRLTQWGADASQRAFQVGGGLDVYTSVVTEAAQAMPVPVHPDAEKWFRDGYDVTALDGPQGAYMLDQLLDDHMPSKKEQQVAMDQAVRVMEQYESASHGLVPTLPVFEQAPGVAHASPEQLPPVVPLPWQGPVPGATPPPVVPGDPSLREPGVRPDGTTTAASVGAPTTGGPGGFGSPVGFGSPAAYGPGGGGSFGPGAGFGPGGGGGGQGGFGPVGPGGASGVLGAVPGGAAARGGVGPVVGGGGPQGFGMYPPMAPGNREEDAEHRNRYDQGLDLLDDLPPAFPPVLGE